jgi:hypothetical protein
MALFYYMSFLYTAIATMLLPLVGRYTYISRLNTEERVYEQLPLVADDLITGEELESNEQDPLLNSNNKILIHAGDKHE